jgi:hypothetical protein
MADSAITAIERHITTKRAELEKIQADLAALERTLAILRSTDVPQQATPTSHAEGLTALDATGTPQHKSDVAPPTPRQTPRRGVREEALQAVIIRTLEMAGHDMAPIEIDRAIRATGRTMHTNAVTSHLSRLWKEGLVRRTRPGRYAAIAPEKQHESVAGNGQLDWEGQEQRPKEDMSLSVSSDITHEESNPEEQNASPGITGEAF